MLFPFTTIHIITGAKNTCNRGTTGALMVVESILLSPGTHNSRASG